MTNAKFKQGDRVLYIGRLSKLNAKVLMVNSAMKSPNTQPFYDISVEGDVYTVHESYLRPLMSSERLAREIAHEYAQVEYHIDQARKALRKVRAKLEEDGQPDYELKMPEEFEIVLKNTLRFELTNEISRWDSITVERKKGN